MTDNRTTELLREGLTKHGIEWRSGLEGVTFVGDWCFVEYDNGRLAATCEPVLTPEQAIAVTMGEKPRDKTEEWLLNACNQAARDYVAQLEQERDELKSKIGAATLGNERATHGTLTAELVEKIVDRNCEWYEGGEIDAQAIFDELNAVLGIGTCEQVLADCDDGLMPPFTAHCSACGAEWGFTPKYCYNCGAKCTGTRDERKAVER